MNDSLLVLVPAPTHIDVFGPDDHGRFTRLARAGSWSETRALFHLLPSHCRPLTVAVIDAAPPDSFLRVLAPPTDRLVFVPHLWLAGISLRRPRLRAHRAARLAATHLAAPIQTHPLLTDDDLPF